MSSDLAQGRAAPVDADVHPLIQHRWSPRAISDRAVEPEKLRAIFEAARWAPSSRNEQPWRFLVATRDTPEALERLRSYLTPGNAWAKRAPVLVASAYKTHFTKNGKPNRVALRDLGAAEENLFLQAYALGLVVHQMAGFDDERLKKDLLPDGFEPGTMFVVGYAGSLDDLPPEQQERERKPRERRPPGEFIFGARWGEPAAFLEPVDRSR